MFSFSSMFTIPTNAVPSPSVPALSKLQHCPLLKASGAIRGVRIGAANGIFRWQAETGQFPILQAVNSGPVYDVGESRDAVWFGRRRESLDRPKVLQRHHRWLSAFPRSIRSRLPGILYGSERVATACTSGTNALRPFAFFLPSKLVLIAHRCSYSLRPRDRAFQRYLWNWCRRYLP